MCQSHSELSASPIVKILLCIIFMLFSLIISFFIISISPSFIPLMYFIVFGFIDIYILKTKHKNRKKNKNKNKINKHSRISCHLWRMYLSTYYHFSSTIVGKETKCETTAQVARMFHFLSTLGPWQLAPSLVHTFVTTTLRTSEHMYSNGNL
jgi:hypothetical protein